MLPGIQKYRGYRIRRLYRDGFGVELPSGIHLKTVESYAAAVRAVDMDIVVASIMEGVFNGEAKRLETGVRLRFQR